MLIALVIQRERLEDQGEEFEMLLMSEIVDDQRVLAWCRIRGELIEFNAEE